MDTDMDVYNEDKDTASVRHVASVDQLHGRAAGFVNRLRDVRWIMNEFIQEGGIDKETRRATILRTLADLRRGIQIPPCSCRIQIVKRNSKKKNAWPLIT